MERRRFLRSALVSLGGLVVAGPEALEALKGKSMVGWTRALEPAVTHSAGFEDMLAPMLREIFHDGIVDLSVVSGHDAWSPRAS